jgi:hypothetical protein
MISMVSAPKLAIRMRFAAFAGTAVRSSVAGIGMYYNL